MSLKTQLVRADMKRPSMSRHRVLPQQIASVFLALVLGAVPLSSAPKSFAAVTVARIEATITTTSGWTTLTLTPGNVVAQRVVSALSDVKVTPFDRGWTLTSPVGVRRTVVVQAVFEETTDSPRIQIGVTKGNGGRTIVTLRNTSQSPFLIARVAAPAPGDRVGTKQSSTLMRLDRSRFFGATAPTLRRADPERHVLAFYYPWFSRSDYDSPRLGDRPTDRLGTVGRADVFAMTRLARRGGIDGFIVEWAGDSAAGEAFDNVLRAAESTGGVATIVLPLVGANAARDPEQPAEQRVVLQQLREALTRAESPAFLRSAGVPVVFVWEAGRIGTLGWRRILDELASERRTVRIVGDASMSTHGSVEWGYYRYDPNPVPTQALRRWYRSVMFDTRVLSDGDGSTPHLFAASVSPGFDDHLVRGDLHPSVDRGEGGRRYVATWESALTASPDWVLVTSWNEWYESTSIQPSETYGDVALRQTAAYAERFSR
jgi:hypothetical protein